MGGKESKPSFILYEEASKRVSNEEFKRLKDAFKRSSTLSGYMTKNLFVREVLGDGVPYKMAELIYEAFGGSNKGLTFKDLMTGLVLITCGRQDEIVKFLFGVYANEQYTHIEKEEMDSTILGTEGTVPLALSDLFLENDKVGFSEFRSWILKHPAALCLSRWLLAERPNITLSINSDTPTFYQTLAGVTHLEESDILELEKRYWALKGASTSGRFDLETFQKLVCPPLPINICQGVFSAFDENRDNHIDFKELACGISACCKGPKTERQKFCFKIFDEDQDGVLSRAELERMVQHLLDVSKENSSEEDMVKKTFHNITPELMTDTILKEHGNGECIKQEEFLVWTVSHPLAAEVLSLLSEICHLILGLKPSTREEEGQIVQNWLAREERRGLQVGQTWYLINIQWWKTWLDFIFHRQQEYQVHPTSPSVSRSFNGKKQTWTPRAGSASPSLSPRKSNKTEDEDAYIVVTQYDSNGGTPEHDTAVIPTKTLTPAHQALCDNTPHLTNIYHQESRLAHSDGVIGNGSIKSYTLSPHSNEKSHNRSRSPSPKIRKRVITPYVAAKPGAIDNGPLVVTNGNRVPNLTLEGGRLKRNTMLAHHRDFELVPEAVWKALHCWYGGTPALPRTVVKGTSGEPELELYPILVRFLRHANQTQRPQQTATFTGMMTGIGGFVSNAAHYATGHAISTIPRRYLAYTACYSCQHTLGQVIDFLSGKLRINRDDLRLWKFYDELNMNLLEDESLSMNDFHITDNQQVLIEVRNKDLTWPEEMSELAKHKDKKQQAKTDKGATGLNNLGNTCFLNSAVQCVSNTRILTQYFTDGMHMYELNRENPLGMKGHVAQRYGELVKDLWSGTARATAPLKLRWTIGKYASQFNGFQQHDSQELLAFLLDGLHEDLNRVHKPPYVELKDSDSRPDEEVAMEAWENHLLRNRSIVVDLFHGQLKSQVRCMKCGHVSVRFDPFTYLSLPLPMESCIHLEVIVFRLDGSVPVKYGLRLTMDDKCKSLKKELSVLCGLEAEQIQLAEIFGALVKSFPSDSQKIRVVLGGNLCAFEVPPLPQIEVLTNIEENNTVGQKETVEASQKKNSPSKNQDIPSTVLQDRPSHSRSPSSGSSIGSSPHSSTHDIASGLTNDVFNGFVVGIHRKMFRMDNYFLSCQKTRPSLFGSPLILPCDDATTNEDLYKSVWRQMARLISPLPVSEGTTNHAQDCDDSLGNQYPFTLSVVQKEGLVCAWCPWYRFCRGCKLNCDSDQFHNGSSYIAVDWDPTAVHLRYQSSQERMYEDHESVAESRRLQNEPIDLDACLRAFTKEEELGEDELYYCSKCKERQLAAKKLDIWKLPPVLIIHLKRFHFVNGHWIKSQKIVNFSKTHFDPSDYVAQRTSYSRDEPSSINTIPAKYRSRECKHSDQNCDTRPSNGVCNSDDSSREDSGYDNEYGDVTPNDVLIGEHDIRPRHLSIGDYDKARFDLYALSCHSGILGGGHYVAYAKNPNNKWYCYNDSSCREIKPDDMDTTTAYILFYERKGLDYTKFMPDIHNRKPYQADDDDEGFESDFKRMCSLQ